MTQTLNKFIVATATLFLFLTSVGVALAAPLSDPTNLSATAVSPSEIDLAWTDNSSKEDGFRIERSTDGSNFIEIDTVGANAESYGDAGLDSSTTYYYRVRGYLVKRNGTTNYSDYSNIDSDSTFDVVPATPTNLSASATDDDVALNWIDNADNETGYKIERDSGGGFSQIDTVGANVTSYDDLNLADGTYTYRVRAYNGTGNSAYSNTDSATVVTLPAAPSSLSASTSGAHVFLGWTDNSDNEVGFKIERDSGIGFTQIDTVSANATTYSDLNLADGTYTYRVRAYNSAGDSVYSNVASTTVSTATAPDAPTNLQAYASSSSNSLVWTDNADDEDNYEIERGTDGINFSVLSTEPANTNFYFDYPLSSTTTYYYRVRATNGAGNSAYSNTASSTPW